MANKPIRALVEAVYKLQQIDDDPNGVTWVYDPQRSLPFHRAISFRVRVVCLLFEMDRFAMFVSGLQLMLQSTIYYGLIDNEYDDEMRAVIHAYNECCQAHDTGCSSHAPTDESRHPRQSHSRRTLRR